MQADGLASRRPAGSPRTLRGGGFFVSLDVEEVRAVRAGRQADLQVTRLHR